MSVSVAVCLAPASLSLASPELSDLLSPWDAAAVTAAIELSSLGDGHVAVVAIGGPEAEQALRRALALGASRAIRVTSPIGLGLGLDPIGAGRAMVPALEILGSELVLVGSHGPHGELASTGSAIGGCLGMPVETGVVAVAWDPAAGRVVIDRRSEDGAIEVRAVETPAVLTVGSGIASPRQPSFRALDRAEAEVIELIDGPRTGPATTLVAVRPRPPGDPPIVLRGSASEIAASLVELIPTGSAR